jgi:hypothetical protein
MAKRPSSQEPPDHPPIDASLSASATYQLGDPIDVTFSIRNSGTRSYQVLAWETPLEDEVTNFLTIECNGQTLRYDGRLVKRGDPTEANYVLLGPGDTLTRTVDVSRSYPIITPGVYRATLNVTLFDTFSVPGNAKVAPRLRAQHQPHEIPKSSVQFTVVPHGQAKQTDGQTVRAKLQEAKPKAKTKAPSVNGGSASQQADTIVAHENAQYFAALAVQQLNSTTASSNALYDEWFGTFDQGRYDSVTDHYSDINKVLETETLTYDLSGTGCQPSYFAYTYSGSRTVWLCGQYLSAPQIGTDCKFGTLIHEWSHAVSDTDDYVYGEASARNLANTDPGEATDNADNHEYFTEHLAQSDFGKVLTFVTDRTQFGRDEVDALLAGGSPAKVENAFYVHADGFWPGKLGLTATSLGASPNVKPTLSTTPSVAGMSIEVTSLQAEDSSLPETPQRFTWVLRVKFASDAGFPTTANTEQIVTLTAALAGLTVSAQVRLVKEGSPYEVDGAVSWLSTDARVFQIREGETRFGVTMGSTPQVASTFIKQVIANLNSGNSGGQTFDGILTDQETSALELAQQVNGTNVYNFAVAKVRYVGTIAISNVRVFFRLFPASTTSTEYAPATSYRRSTQGATAIATLGVSSAGDLVSIPCFAEPRVDSSTASLTTQTDPLNVKATIGASPSGGETVAYFGAWLDINQTQPHVPDHPSPADGPWSTGRKTIQELIRNAHQCLVAEIAYDAAPIAQGVSPGGSDKLAQRNLSIVSSANPGDLASHRIPNAFELWPSPSGAKSATRPDELLIDWGNLPRGASATIYIPEIDAGQIVTLAKAGGRGSAITQVDGQTITLPTGGISYIPLPPRAVVGLTGLLTIDLPETVRKGELYTVVVRQMTDVVAKAVVRPPTGMRIEAPATGVASGALLRWRRIVGSYQLTIPVRTKEVMLPAETRLLSVLRWILGAMASDERWRPVFSRYVSLIADRVRALGGDPERVTGSPAGVPDGRDGAGTVPECPSVDRGPVCQFDGKITGVVYDCFGDFEGFVLDVCGKEVRFMAREHEMEELVTLAWRERIVVSIFARAADPRRPISIIFRRAPEPFQS